MVEMLPPTKVRGVATQSGLLGSGTYMMEFPPFGLGIASSYSSEVYKYPFPSKPSDFSLGAFIML